MWERADAYDHFMGRWSLSVARTLVDVGTPAIGGTCLDLGCGVGTLSGLLADRLRPSLVVGVDRSPAFLLLATRRVPGLAGVRADAARLPLRSGVVDLVVSGLVLNFVGDPDAALAEATRVTRPGGRVVVYVWDYDHPDFFLTWFWRAVATVRGARADADERGRWELCNDAGIAALAARSRLTDVSVGSVLVTTRFRDADELWDGFSLGIGPSGSTLRTLTDDDRARVRTWLAERWPQDREGGIGLTARALTLVGTVA